MPVEDRSRLTSNFGKRDIDNGPRDHWGIDFGGPVPGESVFVKAAADGAVAWIKHIPLRSGPAIGVKHPDGSLTAYLHTRNHKVRPGQKVKRGEVIAETWHTGIPLSNGIHLHFEWWANYRNHRSVFDPIDRLHDYGWAIIGGRMYDQWDGRSTATPITITPASTKPAPTTLEETMAKLDSDDLANIRKIFREESGKQGVDNRKTTAWWKVDGKQHHDTKTRYEQELRAVIDVVAEKVGVSAEEIREIHDAVINTPEEK